MKILLASTTNKNFIKDILDNERENYPLHYFWGVDNPQLNIEIINPSYSKKWQTKLGNFFFIFNLSYQLEILKKAKNYDLLYLNIDAFYTVLAFLRMLKILKTPIIAVCHHSFNTDITNQKKIWDLLLGYRKKIMYKGFDKIVFISEKLLESAKKNHKVPKKHQNFIEWGADEHYFNSKKVNNNDYLAIGASNRDFELIFEVFQEVDANLRLYGKLPLIKHQRSEIPKNIFVDKKLLRDSKEKVTPINKFNLIRSEYHNCKAVLIPLKNQWDIISGLTVLFEAIACGKPLIVTDNIIFPFDVEKEQVGIKLAYGDKKGWVDAITYFENNPNEVKKMGINARNLALTKFNYTSYKKELYKQISSMEKEKHS